MTINIYMPALSPTMDEGSLTKWLVKVGDKVKSGDILAEIETDKATMEVEAVDEGTITKLFFKEGAQSIAVNSIIAILDGGEKDDAKQEEVKLELKEDPMQIKKKFFSEEKKNAVINLNNLSNEIYNDKKKLDDQRIIASPFARNLAKKKNINLLNIIGSGPNDRIIKRDLDVKKIQSSKQIVDIENSFTPSSMRKIIADRTSLTKQTVPHFYLTIESNVDKLLKLRKEINKNSDSRISINDIFVKALAHAQYMNPLTNVSWVEEKIIKHQTIDVSIAVALEEGLITPIVKNANKKGLIEISKEIKYLVDKAKKGKLIPEEYNGGTISISNLGMFGINEFSAIINPPQSSILAVGAIKKMPFVVNDEIKIANVLKSTLSADHRVLDGAIAGKLLKDFSDIIEDPFELWLMSNDMEII